jgi:site-specific DNA-cytosine methylase
MRNKYKQIGNAVPPLLAYAVANSIKEMLNLSHSVVK